MGKFVASILAFSALAAFSMSASPSLRAEDEVYRLTIKDHRFDPPTFEIPAGRKVKLVVKNLDAAEEEFDSHDLHCEKVIAPGTEATIYIGPLARGLYQFMGRYNQATAQGRVIAE